MAPLLISSLTLLVLMMLANNVRSQGDVTSFQIDSFATTTQSLTYERDAYVPSGSDYLRLVGTDSSGRPKLNSVGRVLYSAPVNFWEPGRQASFETTIRFRMSSVANVQPADGLTFFIIPVDSTSPTGGEGENLGIYGAVDPNVVFAAEFDIYSNTVDPNYPHVGINFASPASSNVSRLDNALGQTVTARINYDAPTRRIDVVANYNSQTVTVSYVRDLKTYLPQQVQVGISASTGALTAFFDVFSWYFTSTMLWDGGAGARVHEDAYIKQVTVV